MTVDLANDAANACVPLPSGARLVKLGEEEGLADAYRLEHIKGTLHEIDMRRRMMWKDTQILVSLRIHNGPAATGMARTEDGYRGIFNMRTAVKAHRKVYVRMLLSYLLTSGQAQSAMTGFLQVDEAKDAAVAA